MHVGNHHAPLLHAELLLFENGRFLLIFGQEAVSARLLGPSLVYLERRKLAVIMEVGIDEGSRGQVVLDRLVLSLLVCMV